MLFAQYMCCSPSMEVQIEETGNRKQDNISLKTIFLKKKKTDFFHF